MQYKTATSSTYTIIYPICTLKKWVINIYLAHKICFYMGEKLEVLKSIHKPQHPSLAIHANDIFLHYWTHMTFAQV